MSDIEENEELMSDGQEQEFQQIQPLPPLDDKAERKKRETAMRDEIRRLWLKNPALTVNAAPILPQIDEMNEEDLNNVKMRLELDIIRGAEWSGAERALVRVWCQGVALISGADIEAELLKETEAKVEFREMTGSILMQAPALARFITRSIGLAASKFTQDSQSIIARYIRKWNGQETARDLILSGRGVGVDSQASASRGPAIGPQPPP